MVAMPRDTLEFNQITSMKCSRRPFRMNHMITSGWNDSADPADNEKLDIDRT